MNRARFIFLFVFVLFGTILWGQSSPLLSGKWYQIAVSKQGIYKLTGTQLKNLGFSLPMVSSKLQVYSYDLTQISDKVPSSPVTGLTENAIKVMDGGDGKLDETDYILFYSEGNIQWRYDSLLKRSKHFSNPNSEMLFYYLTEGENGKRIGVQNNQGILNDTKSLFDQYFLFEKDTVSFLNSGKTIWGFPMGQGIGKQPQLSYTINTQGMRNTDLLSAYTQLASTSYSSNGSFDFLYNDQLVHSATLNSVTGLLFDDIASVVKDSFTNTALSSWPNKTVLKVNYNSTSTNATGWIDYIEVHAKKSIGFWQDSTIAFSIEDNKVASYNCVLQNTDTTAMLWNVSQPTAVAQVNLNWLSDGTSQFQQKTEGVSRFFAVRQNAFETPILIGNLPNQNTFGVSAGVEYVIVAAPAYMNAAKKYQAFQLAKYGRSAAVVNARELYHDFTGGQPSAVAIRNYLKQLSKQAAINNTKPPAFLLLMGMGNYNSKKMNLDFELPVYESENSNSILSSYTTDDFFAILADNDDINNASSIKQLSLAVGRIPARNAAEADSAIQKLINYQSNTIGGSWENNLSWVADDGDYNLHLQDAEEIVGHLQSKAPFWDQRKIYLDLFPAASSSAGNSSPMAFNAIQQSVQDGTLMINYTGHGNYLRLSEEAVISQAQIETWNNSDKLPLMVTASCNFAPYDQPGLSPIAWDALMKNSKGIIGLVAANRLVFAYSNKQINDLFIQQLLVPDTGHHYLSIGQALQNAKMKNWAEGGDHINAFKFSLLGDPALKLLTPNAAIKLQKINDVSFVGMDTLLSGNKYKLKGIVQSGALVNNGFNGIVELIVYDAVKYKKTLANQSTSMVVPIAMQENILFKGKASVVNGSFEIDFILPKQVSNVSSPLRLSLVATSGLNTAIQIVDSIYVKANSNLNQMDTAGPTMKAYLNDPLFKQGGWAAPNSILYISLADSSGIQTSGNALGQDLAIWIDDNPVPIVINNYFVADIDTYKTGKLMYALPTLSEGIHKCIIKAWDLLGNGSVDTLDFEVPKSKEMTIKNPVNFPNPFTTQTRFSFETNLIGKELQVILEVLDINGQLQYTNETKFNNNSTKVYIDWDGITNAGTNLQKGVYFYRITLKTPTQTERLSNTFIKL